MARLKVSGKGYEPKHNSRGKKKTDQYDPFKPKMAHGNDQEILQWYADSVHAYRTKYTTVSDLKYITPEEIILIIYQKWVQPVVGASGQVYSLSLTQCVNWLLSNYIISSHLCHFPFLGVWHKEVFKVLLKRTEEYADMNTEPDDLTWIYRDNPVVTSGVGV